MGGMMIASGLLLIMLGTSINAFELLDHLGTSTPYRPSPESGVTPPPSCQLHQVNMVLRHGTRHPTPDTVREADVLYRQLQDVLARQAQVPNWLREWRPRFDRSQSGELTTIGVREHYELARRLAARYPDVFGQPHRADLARLRSTKKSRAQNSARAFAIGLWHKTGNITQQGFELASFIYTTGPLNNDPILRPFDMCPRYNYSLQDPQTRIHYRQYMTRTSPRIAAHIQARMGIELDPRLVKSLWKMCKAEVSALGSSSLCALFDADDVLALELGDDIGTYWKKGPGRPINSQMICPLLQDIQTSITAASQDVNSGRLDLRFAHAETIIPLVTSLGLFQDNHNMTSDSDVSQLRSRSWRMSRVSPYAANVAFHLFRCPGQILIEVLHNEQPLPMPFCSGQYFCPMKTFQDHLMQFTSCCNLTKICSL